MEEFEEAKTETVVESQIDRYERLLTNMVPMASSQPHDESLIFSINNVSTPSTRTPPYEAPPFIFLLPDEKLLSTTSNNNTLQGTPRSNTDPIDYKRIINNAYDLDASHSDSEETASVIANTSNPHQEDIANNHNDIEDDIDDFFQNQDRLQAQEGEGSSLNAEAEAEYEDTDRYLRMG